MSSASIARLPVPAVAAAALAMLVPGCADDAGPAQLMSYLPTDAAGATAVDVDGARSDLELADDADALDPELPGLSALVGVGGVRYDPADPAPFYEALDGSAISAVAGSPAVTVIATEQSFDELAAELEGDGFEREGDALVATGEVFSGDAAEIAAGPDGIVIATTEDESAAELAAEPPGGPEELIELVGGAGTVRGGVELGEDAETDETHCHLAVGGRQNADGSFGALLIRVDEDAVLDRVDAGSLTEYDLEIDPGLPTVAGPTVEIPFTAPAAIPSEDPIGTLLAVGAAQAAYPCPPR